MFRALTANLVLHERIETTDAKAKELRRVAERLLSQAIRLGNVAVTPDAELSPADKARRLAAARQVGRFLQRFGVRRPTARAARSTWSRRCSWISRSDSRDGRAATPASSSSDRAEETTPRCASSSSCRTALRRLRRPLRAAVRLQRDSRQDGS